MISYSNNGAGITALLDNKKLTDEERQKILVTVEALSLIYNVATKNSNTSLLEEMGNLEKYVEKINAVLK